MLKEKEEEAKKQFMKENPGFEDLCKEQKKKKKKGSAWEHAEQDCTAAELDPGHSHFFLIQSNKNDKTGNGFGTEIPSRTAFEERVNKHGRPVTDQTEQERTPMVLLCVQGGPGTVNTVLSALKKRMPVLLVKGSGQAADLIADLILFNEEKEEEAREREAEAMPLTEPDEQELDLLETLLSHFPQHIMPNEQTGVPSDTKNLVEQARKQVCRAYFGISEPEPKDNIIQAVVDAVEAWRSGHLKLCRVFNLKEKKEEFSDSLLECIYHGLEHRPDAAPNEHGNLLETKLCLAVEFNNFKILQMLVEEASTSAAANADSFLPAMAKALQTALLKKGRAMLVDYLVNHGALVDGYEMPKFNPAKENQDQPKPRNRQNWEELVKTLPLTVYSNSERDNPNFDVRQWFEQRMVKYIGPGFDYHMSTITPEFDLMILAAFRNERKLCFVWWKEYSFPIRAALSIAMLYRQLEQKTQAKPHDKKTMLASADFFEELATNTQRQCFETSFFLSISNLEVPMRMWKGNTLIDVAVRSDSESFLEECCKEAIDRRFAGDLLVYGQGLMMNHWWLEWTKGLKRMVFLNICCLGLFAPYSLKYNYYPAAENLRYPTQRMDVPGDFNKDEGRTHFYSADDTGADERLEKPRKTLPLPWNRASGDSEEAKERMTWWHAFGLFWQAPVTLFVADGMQRVFLLVASTWWIFSTPDSSRREPFFQSYAISPDLDNGVSLDWKTWPFETVALVMFFGSSIVSSFVELYITGSSYFRVVWNWLDFTSALLFFTGYGLRYVCSSHPHLCLNPSNWDQVESVRIDGMWVYMYSLSLFLQWVRGLRVLSVSDEFGPLVIIIIRMGSDILRFALVYLVFLIAFSVVIRGSMPYDYAAHCSADTPATCWMTWSFIRTFIQASGGEVYLEDMKTDAAVGSMMILWVVMNLLLLNLVVAIMSNTYQTVKDKSEKIHLFEMYEITKAFSRRSLAAPWPLNVCVFFLFDYINYWAKRTQVNKLYQWPNQSESTKLDLYLRRNRRVDELAERKDYPAKGGDGYIIKENLQIDSEVEQFWELRLRSFTERARVAFLKSDEYQQFCVQWQVPQAAEDTIEATREVVSLPLDRQPPTENPFALQPKIRRRGSVVERSELPMLRRVSMERRSVDRGRPRRERRPSVEILDPAADVRSSSSAVFQLQGIAQAMQSTRALASPTQRPTRADAAQHPFDMSL